MKSILIISVALAVSCMFLSCEKTADITTPEFKPKLVIHSFICPDDTFIRVHVGTNRNVFGEIRDYPKSLPVTVTLIDGDIEKVFGPRDSSAVCSLKYKIEPGKEYKLIARCDGYPDATARCRVPDYKNFIITADTLTELYTYEYGTYKRQKFVFKFDDIQGMTNFYSIYATRVETSVYGTNVYPLNIIDSEGYYYSYYMKLLTDHLVDGKTFLMEFNTYFDVNDRNLTSLEFNAYVLETDADYYKYHNSLEKYTDADEPLTEFSPVYTNVSGGYGIFASYVRHKKTLKLK